MTRKDKVKELVGRGLNSYHAKALQQIDRINKKNKEQNHKISILTNELDNDYLTKTEEGSVVSLEHSKEGMVYLDELQGNTMVNYCTDGSKEMTLNGDIDVEGIFVTTTEGVDNGKVDVMCEGNTLVNLANHNALRTPTKYSYLDNGYITYKTDGVNYMDYIYLNINQFKPSTTYTIILDIKSNTFNKEITLITNSDTIISSYQNPIPAKATGIKTIKFTTKSDFNNVPYGVFINGGSTDGTGNIVLRTMILEGDWTNRELPSYFEEMKSVGQDDENGHKIEILSQNKNFVVNGFEGGNIDNSGNLFNQISYLRSVDYEHCVPNTEIIASYNGIFRFSQFFFYDKNKSLINRQTVTRTVVPNNARYFKLVIVKKDGTEVTSGDINSYANKTTMVKLYTQSDVYIEPKSNKKEISLNEPLRGITDKIKDRFVKIGNKWFIERNCIEFEINETNVNKDFYIEQGKDIKGFIILAPTNKHKLNNNAICDRVSRKQVGFQKEGIGYFYENPMNFMFIFDINTTIDDAKSKLIGAKILCQLETPAYEEIIDSTLTTYLDIAHISNNSIIPCNMKIKNSGYNAIIKPSTLYTVALDTNKAGTIGVNLGGAKGTTNNNVLTLTTPATLSDDSLRVSGKGIKGSKLRLLEGDKTNWVPSFFEGMQSSFEDKFDEVDNCYKMEILSNNENLIDIANNSWETIGSVGLIEKIGSDITFDCNGSTTGGYGVKMSEFMHLKPNTQYVLNANWEILRGTTDLENLYLRIFSPMTNTYFGTRSFDGLKFTTDATGIVKPMLYIDTPSRHDIKVKFTDIQLKEVGNVNYILNKHNKIQFSSIEPLRSVGDVKDRFVFVDGKLMIERKCRAYVCDDNSKWVISSGKGEDTSNAYYIRLLDAKQVKKTHDFIASNKAYGYTNGYCRVLNIDTDTNVGFYNYTFETIDEFKQKQYENPTTIVYELKEPIYEEIPYELQKIILEGYENGTLFIDTNIPPTVTTTYAGETPIVNATKTNRVEVSSNTTDINENIIPYLMDMDYRVAVLYLQSENISGTMNVSRVFGGVKEMLIRDIKSKRYSAQEYLNRISTYHAANKITIEEMEEIKSVIMEVYNG